MYPLVMDCAGRNCDTVPVKVGARSHNHKPVKGFGVGEVEFGVAGLNSGKSVRQGLEKSCRFSLQFACRLV